MKPSSRLRLLWTLALILLVVAATAILLLPAPGQGPEIPAAPQYVGTGACEECHADETQRWRGSRHELAMQPASPTTVLGDFGDARFGQGSASVRFLRRQGRYAVRTGGPDGRTAEFPVAFVLGTTPVQQYVVELARGRYQVLDVAWDGRPAAQGGGRWFHLRPEQIVGHRNPLHWTRPSHNWNSECAGCHATNVRKGYRPAQDGFRTTFAAPGVACEACHGPGSRHVVWARSARARGRSAGAEPGLIARLGERQRSWEMDAAKGSARLVRPAEASPAGQPPADPAQPEVEACSRCHARSRLLDEDDAPGRLLLQTRRPELLDLPSFRADGQPQAEGPQKHAPLTWSAFMQSRMHAAGVTCSDCHDPHDLKLRADGDAVCSTCHLPERFATRQHHLHREASRGASCAACHMRAAHDRATADGTTHDHSFRVPRPDLTAELGQEHAPNACNDCHRDRSPRWAAQALRRAYAEGHGARPHYGEAIHAGRAHAPGAEQALSVVLRDPKQPAIVRATALTLLFEQPRPAWIATLQKAATDPEPLVRMAAASVLETLPVQERVRAGVTLLWDPVLAVRVEAVPAFADVPDSALASEQRAAFDRALDDYYLAQRTNAERPESHVRLGVVHAKRGRLEEARRHYETALRLAPWHVPAYVELAELLRVQGREDEAEPMLRRGVKAGPQDAAAHHALGRLLLQRKRQAEALRELQRASELQPREPALASDYAAALQSAGRADEALGVLRAAQKRSPGSRRLLQALATACRDEGRLREAREWARLLLAAAPTDTAARALAAELDPAVEPGPAQGPGVPPAAQGR